jgi:hypothetical protein
MAVKVGHSKPQNASVHKIISIICGRRYPRSCENAASLINVFIL